MSDTPTSPFPRRSPRKHDEANNVPEDAAARRELKFNKNIERLLFGLSSQDQVQINSVKLTLSPARTITLARYGLQPKRNDHQSTNRLHHRHQSNRLRLRPAWHHHQRTTFTFQWTQGCLHATSPIELHFGGRLQHLLLATMLPRCQRHDSSLRHPSSAHPIPCSRQL